MPKFIYIEYTFNKTQTYDSIFYNILFQKEIEIKRMKEQIIEKGKNS